MNKSIFVLTFMLMTAASLMTSCGTDNEPIKENTPTQVSNPQESGDNDNSGTGNDNNKNDNEGETDMYRNITIHVGDRSFAATLEDNSTARAFAALLPMTVTMNEMNGNEKYHYLSENLPTDSYRPGTIRNGDLMLYGSNCIVLFYETFSSSYSYTRIGQIDNPSGLASALGTGRAIITFGIDND